ncbi:AbrB/MazE/SpoVT family DNA-binding domain-containing protein [Candidatus Nitrosocosmicus agrestis]|jgi:antitoxin component of MazEF toxin-antitoxin module|uniref:AbrB/MazE/SpoVT family DNA-binding domain-containing protein n=1 Tax=Candidatus Nitrosocosmicus agrestis TaxID=2563600 RepID=UPI00122DDF0B|nr:AbrB/MazE/SpoVT family DNA-binding domain-containing protein [Candidatus Nitrosocosmicus sp. SS]KAA2279388.1 AbrB/MazE/SpoVT family DNA-binding domain-containing protein [Candidatus Nitrosocosmicus sp. SS]
MVSHSDKTRTRFNNDNYPQPIIAALGLKVGDHLEIQFKKGKIIMTKKQRKGE